jgi:hypothetical protein
MPAASDVSLRPAICVAYKKVSTFFLDGKNLRQLNIPVLNRNKENANFTMMVRSFWHLSEKHLVTRSRFNSPFA